MTKPVKIRETTIPGIGEGFVIDCLEDFDGREAGETYWNISFRTYEAAASDARKNGLTIVEPKQPELEPGLYVVQVKRMVDYGDGRGFVPEIDFSTAQRIDIADKMCEEAERAAVREERSWRDHVEGR